MSEESLAVKTLDELQAECEAAVVVELEIRARKRVVELRRLRPEEEASIDLILSEARPPRAESVDGREAYDWGDETYLKKSKILQREARAMALWWSCPLFAASADAPKASGDGGMDRKRITEFIQKKLTERALDHLYAAARGDVDSLDRDKGETLERRIGFI
jgi:hypothetical protein